MNWPALTNDIAAAARQSFSDLFAHHGDETFYAFALYTDEDCITVAPAANSLEQYQATLATLNKPDRQERAYYQWASPEWAYEAWAWERLDGEGCFGRHRQGPSSAVLFITSSDSDGAEEMEDQSARLLNRPEVCKTFLKQHKDMG